MISLVGVLLNLPFKALYESGVWVVIGLFSGVMADKLLFFFSFLFFFFFPFFFLGATHFSMFE